MIGGLPLFVLAGRHLILYRDITVGVMASVAMIAAIIVGEYDAAALVVFMMSVGEWLEDLTVARSNNALRELASLVLATVTVRRDASETVIPIDEVMLDDVVLVKTVERMAEVLGRPRYDPHGAPIPTRGLEIPAKAGLCLNEIRSGQRGILRQVPDDDPELLRYLGDTGLIPGARFEVVEFTPFDELHKIQVDGQPEPVVLGPKLTHAIYVELET